VIFAYVGDFFTLFLGVTTHLVKNWGGGGTLFVIMVDCGKSDENKITCKKLMQKILAWSKQVFNDIEIYSD